MKALSPMGIMCVMPPTQEDRFQGARVAIVIPGSAADLGGMKPGDLITAMGGETIGTPHGVGAALELVSPNKPVPVTVLRNGKQLSLTLTGMTALPFEEQVYKRKGL
jgi:S1-C subfamily serine protease